MRTIIKVVTIITFASIINILYGCEPTQAEMENNYRGGKTFCQAHSDLEMCRK